MENKTPGITADDIVNKSKQWTLEGDCTLLRWMEQISKNLEERATKITSDLNDLSTNLERTSIALSNATNRLAALQYTQFVENRVHDDDETLANVEEVPNPSSDVVDKSTNDSSMYAFLKKNLEMMNSCHEAYSFSYDDSDEDEPATNVVYRSKNPYEARPLPHIYGTNLWKEKWHIGLCDSDNDFSGDENSEQFSESSSETDNSYESTAQTMSEWDSTAWGLNGNPGMEQKQFRLPSNDGESYTQSEVSTPTEQRRNRVPIVQPVQDQRYYQHVPRKQDNLFDDIFADSSHSTPHSVAAPAPPPVQQPEKVYHESLIPDEPPPDEPAADSEPNKRLGAKKTLNLFDDDEFSSFMNQIVETAKNVKSAPPQAQPESPKRVIPNLFEDHDDPILETAKNVNSAPPQADPLPAKKAVPNLFEDHDDLFAVDDNETPSAPKQLVQSRIEEKTFAPSSPPRAAARTKIRNLFEDDDDDEDDFERMFAANQRGADPFLKKTTNLFDNDSDDENDTTTIAPAPAAKPHQAQEATVKEIPAMRKGLFDDDEDDLFKVDKPSFSIKKPTERSTLFSDEEKVEPSKAAAVEIPKETSKNAAEKVSEIPKTKPDFADMFQDEPPEEIFPPTPSARKTKVADIFADDFADDFEEFLPKPSMPATANVEKPTVPATVDFSDLFQDQPPEDIFQSSSMTNPAPAKPKIEELFADDLSDEPEQTNPKRPLDFEDQSEQPKSKTSPDDLPPNASPVVPMDQPTPDVEQGKEQNPAPEDVLKQTLEEDNKPVEAAEPEPPKDGEATHSTDNKKADLVEEKPKPSPAVPSFSSLFPDEPPSDDEVPPGPSPTTEKDTANFSSINLFADVPPDDDFQVAPPTETKRIHSIFYDDFNETIEATREMRAPSNYIFNDEPPPDDDTQAIEDKPLPKPTTDEKKDKVKVSKLKKFDLQINVGALLPTAKLPSFKKPEAVPQRAESTSAARSLTPPEEATKEVRQNRDLPENILPNLNKDRVKLGVKRRPSTRRGRQESYRKSLIEEVSAAPASDEEDDADPDSASTKQPDSPEEIFASRSLLSKIPPRIQEEEKQRSTLSPSQTSARPGRGTSLFEDFGDFGGGKLTSDKPQPEPSSDHLFHDNEAVVNPFGTPKTTPQPSTEATPTSSQRTVSLFDDSDDAPPLEQFPAKDKGQTKPPSAVQSTKVASLFDDSDDGSDDLFKEPKSMKKPTQQQKPVEAKPKKEAVPPKQAKQSTSLFSSDEGSESDDIFGKSKLKVKPAKKMEATKTKKSTSLFADLSDDDEDDLFGTSKKKPSSVEKPKAKASTPQPGKTTTPPQQQPTTTSYNPLSDLLDD